MSKIYTIRDNESIWNKWIKVVAKTKCQMQAIFLFQNSDVPVTSEKLNEWFSSTTHEIEEVRAYQESVIKELYAMRDESVRHIKDTN